MTDPNPIVRIERDHPGDHDSVWLDEIRQQAAHRLAESVPPRYAGARPDNAEVCRWVREVVDHAVKTQRGTVPSVRRGPSLLLLGPTGVGKTHQAYGALHAFAESGVQCSWKFTTAADMYAHLRPRSGVDTEAEFGRYALAPLLVIDDLGAAKGSEWVEEVNYRLINFRYEHMLPTLITTNVRPGDLEQEIGKRVASRLLEMADRAAMVGTDRRKAE